MISEIAAWLFALFVVNPMHAELSERFNQANLPLEALHQSKQCVATHAPRLLDRAAQQPGWATSTAIGVLIGWTSPSELFERTDPHCAVLVRLFDAEAKSNEEA